MGVWVHVRGWLEFHHDSQRRAFERILGEAPDPGWAFPRGGWLDAACYARAVRERHVDELLGVIRQAAALPAADADGDRVAGLFLVSHDMHGRTEWQVHDGRVHIVPADERHDYLDR
ncbi:hypothetical protein [Nonomuraea candida]|uniref:hypothetical protein n=1 Tax=Nonomuraea candida TaxID=359159 RepID=UPI0005BDAFEE|nr:hypothetical protein [Nonomuraea candida]